MPAYDLSKAVGMSSHTAFPIASTTDQPNIRSAPAFQLAISQRSFSATIAWLHRSAMVCTRESGSERLVSDRSHRAHHTAHPTTSVIAADTRAITTASCRVVEPRQDLRA